jgi:Ca2+/Na+ antiporter
MKPYWKITLWYLLFGVLWILLTDAFLMALIPDSRDLTMLQSLKGCAYVLLSALFIWQITRSAFQEQESRERERRQVFMETVKASNHILRNYLNQMQLVTEEAEKCHGFDKDTVKLAHAISKDAESQLVKLGRISEISPDEIRLATSPK